MFRKFEEVLRSKSVKRIYRNGEQFVTSATENLENTSLKQHRNFKPSTDWFEGTPGKGLYLSGYQQTSENEDSRLEIYRNFRKHVSQSNT